MGEVLQAGVGQAPARRPRSPRGCRRSCRRTINKVCASSIRAVQIADLMIRAGDHQVVVTGGMESMSNAPYLLKKARFGYKLGDGKLIDHMTYDGLTSTFDSRHMVEQASFVSREARHLARGPGRLGAALARARDRRAGRGRFADEIVAVDGFDTDEGHAATRRSSGSPRCSRSSTRTARRPPETRPA